MSETAISDVHKRKHLLRHRARLCEAWDRLFPRHDIETARLKPEHITSIADAAWNDTGWAKAAREYHKARGDRVLVVETEPKLLARLRELMADNVSLDQAWDALNDPRSRRTPAVTIEALWLSIRERGLKALEEPSNQIRLESCDIAARTELARCIKTLRPDEVSS
jgi:hypothetical protein